MRDWKIKMVQAHKRTILEQDPEAYWSDHEIDDQYVEEMAEI